MAESDQFLHVQIDGQEYLLPSGASFTIEQRESLVAEDNPGSAAVAWRTMKSERWPVYCLDRDLKATRRDNWQKAVFLEAQPFPVGFVADEARLLPRTEINLAPFTPLGTPSTQFGHLVFSAWIREGAVILILELKALTAYLQSLGGE